jgi:hypothetical protein
MKTPTGYYLSSTYTNIITVGLPVGFTMTQSLILYWEEGSSSSVTGHNTTQHHHANK